MFYLQFFLLLKKYSQYYQNINDYSKYKSEILTINNQETMLLRIFNNYGVYDIHIINGIIQTFHDNLIYFR